MIDSHCHLNDPKLLPHLEDILRRGHAAGVDRYIVPGYDLPSSIQGVKLAQEHPEIYGAVGIHPHDAKTWTQEVEVALRGLLQEPKVVALGEIGLDYHYDNSPRDLQKEVFIRQLELAKEFGKPVVIHSREAFQDTFEILKEHGQGMEGIFHCFSGSYESALRVIGELNFSISLGGPVTFPNAKEPLEVATRIPLSRLLLETDCPYLTPHPHRGKTNEPSYLPLIAETISRSRGEDILEVTTQNAKRLFHLE